jgi:hypothetical protein
MLRNIYNGCVWATVFLLSVVGWIAGIFDYLPMGLHIVYLVACGIAWVGLGAAGISLFKDWRSRRNKDKNDPYGEWRV